ncbi:glutactin-like [Wyeomyia smithii]|uniref:glutactin-like n=1 Tax=Wyeomyia smithii TaxID=174621 RepID=UPI002467B25C|nr:glutactin-like [Wyeomyia smithii]
MLSLVLLHTWIASLVLVGAQSLQSPVVNIPELGTVQGSITYTSWTNRTIYQFLAIPYAKSPTGNLRFQPPVKAPNWEGTLDASKPGIICPQSAGEYVNLLDEDCLTLSVYSNDLTTPRPVMVFIHGGWFFVGAASQYQPNFLLEADVVLVVIQYRLGPLGFLSTLSDEIPGNVGILDMILALEWVQNHIASFGGNNQLVTIFGESAGSAGVSALLHTPLTQKRPEPLFHRAILQSGSVFSPWATCDTPIDGAYDIARRLGCTDNLEQCLLQTSVQDLVEAFGSHRTNTIINQGYPNVAGTTLVVGGPSGLFPTHPSTLPVSSNISVMAGVTSQEGLFLLDEICSLQPEKLQSLNSSHDLLSFVRLLHEKFGQTKLDGALEGYAFSEHFLVSEIDQFKWKNIVLGLTDICGNHGIKGPVLVDTTALATANPGRVFLYSFDYPVDPSAELPLVIPFPYEGPVHHANDMYYLFSWSNLSTTETKIAQAMVQLWTSFAKTGVPTAEIVPNWSPVKNLFGPYLVIDENMEEKENFLNEFTATTNRYRTSLANGKNYSNVLTIIIVCLVFVFRSIRFINYRK